MVHDIMSIKFRLGSHLANKWSPLKAKVLDRIPFNKQIMMWYGDKKSGIVCVCKWGMQTQIVK